jgi:hypothetical protein
LQLRPGGKHRMLGDYLRSTTLENPNERGPNLFMTIGVLVILGGFVIRSFGRAFFRTILVTLSYFLA